MAKKCDFCGKNISSLNEFNRTLDEYNCKLCENCATSFDGLVTPSLGRYSDSLEWKKQIINENKLNSLIKDAFVAETGIRPNLDNNKVNNATLTTASSSSSYSQNGQSSLWIGILKIMAALSVVVMIVVCSVIGSFLLDGGGGAVLGLLVGVVIGMISISAIMVFLNMAEDIKSNYAVSVNIQKTLESISKKM